MKPFLIALPGFMGHPSDWDVLQLDTQIQHWQLSDDAHSMHAWASELNQYAAAQPQKPFLMGYSFGGRIALHAITASPHLWSGAIIISAHPGLSNEEEKQKRYLEDLDWSERFIKLPWNKLMAEWNSRSAFANDNYTFFRREQDYDRNNLSRQLLIGSLGKQQDLSTSILALDLPILWIVGENDRNYSRIADSLTFSHPHSQVWKVPSVGHRALWEQPILCGEKIKFWSRACNSW